MEPTQKRRRRFPPPVCNWIHKEVVILGVDIGIRNLSLCKLRLSVEGAKLMFDLTKEMSPLQRWKALCRYVMIEQWDVVDLLNGRSLKGMCHSRLLDSLHEYFSKGPGQTYLENVNFIVIESQMTAKMKMISAGVYMLSKTLAPAGALVQFQTASKKLALDSSECQNEFGFAILTETYAKRKKSAIALCKALLEQHSISANDCISTFLKSKKKDDLADSFLHAMYVLSDATLCISWAKHMNSHFQPDGACPEATPAMLAS